jgi:hypothetical protein
VNLSRQFEHERARRTIEETTDPAKLRQIALTLLSAWQAHQETTEALIAQGWLQR